MTGISLSALDATKACSGAFEFEYIDPAGNKTGIFFSVLGAQSEAVTSEVANLVNDRRRKQALRQMNATVRTGRREPEFEPLESDVEFGQRLSAVRLVGWRGIAEPFTKENALQLCQSNRDVAAQITEHSENLANFMKL